MWSYVTCLPHYTGSDPSPELDQIVTIVKTIAHKLRGK
jgi:hypothetical protein